MNTPKTYAILLLALTTLGGAGLAWRQYGELVELRAEAMNKTERADWQKKVWDAEKRNRELQEQLAAVPAKANPDGENVVTNDRGAPRAERNERKAVPNPARDNELGALQQVSAVRDLLARPDVQALVNMQQKARIDGQYAALFRNLNLPADQLDKLKSLLSERQNTRQDVTEAARAQGMDPRSDPAGFRKLYADAQNEINNSIKAVVGDSGFAQLQTYEATLPQRNQVNELQQRLSYTDTPLTPAQADQLVQILANNAPQRQAATAVPGQAQPAVRGGGAGTDGIANVAAGVNARAAIGDVGGALINALGGGSLAAALEGGGRAAGGPMITATAVAQSQAVLAAPQVAALQQIQQQQQAQIQLSQLVRDTLQQNAPQRAVAPGAPAAPAPAGGSGSDAKRKSGGPGGG